MNKFNPIRNIPAKHGYGPNDTLIVFGELFDRGYANGVVDQAQAAGMNIIYSTIGRRDSNGELRPLNAEELESKAKPLINIPLEAGFDMDKDSAGQMPIDQLKNYGLKGWENAKLNWKSLEESRLAGRKRFSSSTSEFLSEVQKKINIKGNIVFLHTMAGGFPRAKVVMPIANKVFKGTGDRFQSSKDFWESEIGKLCDWNFNEVTGNTFKTLIDSSENIRNMVQKEGGKVSYLAFGYHGNEVLIDDQYTWYSYSPYLQGWAKILLENCAKEAQSNGVNASVFNVPEILTNSSSIFLGVEVVLYPLLRAFLKEDAKNQVTKNLLEKCQAKLKDEFTFKDIDELTQKYLTDSEVRSWPSFDDWPQHNGPEQMQKMRDASTALIDMHKDRKDLMTTNLSEIVFKSCGLIMLRQAFKKMDSINWIGHDLVAKTTLSESVY